MSLDNGTTTASSDNNSENNILNSDNGGEKELPTLKELLKQLGVYASKIQTEPINEVKKLLTGVCDYADRFMGNIDEGGPKVKEQVKNLYKLMVNEAIQVKLDLSKVDKEEVVNKELCQLLRINENTLGDYFTRTMEFQNASSPLHMAEHLKRGVIQQFVKNLIQYQFDMKWNTGTGKPADYTFYQFCDCKNTTELLKYIPRQAHVKVTLYKECRKKNVATLQAITKNQLCPKVYINTDVGWKTYQADKEGEFNDVDINKALPWVNQSIRSFITENADEQNVESLKDSLTKPTLYWAVLGDKDFNPGETLKLKSIGQTQVYVGKANNGIQGRWMKDSDNHCKMMKKCLDNVCAMMTYDPMRLEGVQLVDARLALAKVREENTALFVINTFGDDVEKAEIALKKAKKRLDEVKELPQLVQQRQEELDEATAVVNDLKEIELSKSEVEVQLEQAEKSHRRGKRIDQRRKNIIPYKKYSMTWKPTNMGYGMNFN